MEPPAPDELDALAVPLDAPPAPDELDVPLAVPVAFEEMIVSPHPAAIAADTRGSAHTKRDEGRCLMASG